MSLVCDDKCRTFQTFPNGLPSLLGSPSGGFLCGDYVARRLRMPRHPRHDGVSLEFYLWPRQRGSGGLPLRLCCQLVAGGGGGGGGGNTSSDVADHHHQQQQQSQRKPTLQMAITVDVGTWALDMTEDSAAYTKDFEFQTARQRMKTVERWTRKLGLSACYALAT